MSVDALKQQILSQGRTGKWSGQGFGSAEANAEDMAKILSGIGITDIRQFGEVTKTVPAVARYTLPGAGVVQKSGDSFYKTVEVDTGDGSYTQQVKLSDAEVENLKTEYGTYKTSYVGSGDNQEYVEEFVPVDPSKIIDKDGIPHVDTGEKTYGNKETGQAVPNTYGERQTGNAFGGTYAGEGNTGYRVQFAEDGTPVFYTTQASSNDLVNLIGDNKLLMVAAGVGAAYFGGPAGAAALQAAMGKDITDIAKSAALSYVGGQVAGGVSGSQSVIDALGQTGAKIAGNMAGAVATGKDPLTVLATAGLGPMLGEKIGLEGTTASVVGSSLVNGVIADLQGKDVSDALIAGAVSGYFSGEKKLDEARKAADADLAGGLDPNYGSNSTYDTFMESAMTPEARAAIENQFGLGDYQMTKDYGAGANYSLTDGLTFPSLEGLKVDKFTDAGSTVGYSPVDYSLDMSTPFEGLQMPESSNLDVMGGGQGLTVKTPDGVLAEGGVRNKDTSFDLGSPDSFINKSYNNDAFDATEREGSLAKDSTSNGNSLGDALKTGLKTALVGGGAAAAIGAINGLGSRPTSLSLNFNEDDIYKDAPLKGYHMKKDETTGRYIPYIGDRALLAKGGFVSKRK